MATVAFFHAHPDDECIATGGTMARLHDEGHRVVLITATRGELGEVADGFLRDGEELGQRRVDELHASARELGVAYGHLLDHRDSGMAGTEGNDDPACFWQADVEAAAQVVAEVLREQQVDVLVVYDERGVYGHPDHIQVHRVGTRAAELAGTPGLYESTIDRDAVMALVREGPPAGFEGAAIPEEDVVDLGVPADQIDTRIDVTGYTDRKRAAMRCHASQISEVSFFLQMPDDMFRRAFGTEWFIKRRAPEGTPADHLVPVS